MKAAHEKTRDNVLGMYRAQLKKFRELCVYDDNGKFLFGKYTEFGTKVTKELIEVTERRLHQLVSRRISPIGLRLENYLNGKADEEVR